MCAGNVKMHGSLPKSGQKIRSALFAGLAVMSLTQWHSGAIEVWNGPPIAFINVDGSDPSLAENQDRITPSVWLVRGASQGIYNARIEFAGYQHSLSPVGTEWAYGQLTNYAALSYQTWEDWFGGKGGGGPPSTLGKDAVVHIIPEDVYLYVQFTSWGVATGGFSYVRSTQFVPEPASSLLILAGLAMRGIRVYRRRRNEFNR